MSTTERPTIKALDEHDEAVGQTLGHYKLLERIGEGGCGVVYVAEQSEPVRRRVALKVIKLGMDTKSVVARFEAERQALAMMDHPNIAKVLDAGATEKGRPYFVMELVRGIRITDYCDQSQLTTKERLELFIQVCQAIQHAHQKGIIHRDIKPSNILVTLHDGVPVPKVIDFGIAKATEGRLTEATVYTQLHQFIGTPAYMSPEQAEMSGLDVDTRSDIYSLGLLLYELLTGKTPFDARELVSEGIDAMRKTIREKEPLRPSTRLATLQGEELTTTAKRRSVEASKLSHLLRGDLDWIVMKCLEKDRRRRYETANGLAADLKRHLNDETVVARPATQLYRWQKIVRRHKPACAAAAMVALALILGTGVSLWQAVRAKRAEARALQTRGDAEELSNFLLEGLYDELEPTGRFETLAGLASKAVAYYDRTPASLRRPDTERNRALAQARLALISASQADLKAALPLASSALATFEHLRRAGDRSEGTFYGLGLALLAQHLCFLVQRDPASSTPVLQRGVEVLKPLATSPEGSRRIKFLYAEFLNHFSFYQPLEKGVASCEEALRILAGLGALELSDLSAATAWANTADSEARHVFRLGRLDDAERLEKQVYAKAEQVLSRRPGDLHAPADRYSALDMLTSIAAGRFQDTEAAQLAARAQAAAENYVRLNPSDEQGWVDLGRADYKSASVLFHIGRPAEALQKARATLERPLEAASTNKNLVPTFLLRAAIASWEAQRGVRVATEQALQEARRDLDAFLGRTRAPYQTRALFEAGLENRAREVKMAFGEDAAAFSMAKSALGRLERPKEVAGQGAGPGSEQAWLANEALALGDSARAALNLGRYSEAEAAARTLTGLRFALEAEQRDLLLAPRGSIDVFWGQVLLAQAETGQGRREGALKTIEPALTHYRKMQVQGASYLSFRQHFARALYAQAVAQPADAPGNAQRRDSLDQAARLLNDLPEEARQLHDSKELLGWIESERKKLSQNPQRP
jgi:serine/threonine protein kinase